MIKDQDLVEFSLNDSVNIKFCQLKVSEANKNQIVYFVVFFNFFQERFSVSILNQINNITKFKNKMLQKPQLKRNTKTGIPKLVQKKVHAPYM